ncbi:MAG TPA: protein kinase [Candidatus Polarisedimenticolaceae bacterium]|nr:protein kinase [Candidatus Polarisedimenticolaceae bacterium]
MLRASGSREREMREEEAEERQLLELARAVERGDPVDWLRVQDELSSDALTVSGLRRLNHLLDSTDPSRDADVQEDLTGRTISRFKVLGRIGAGGMGVVYRAVDVTLGREVALKFLPDALARDPAALARLRREARAASVLNHPNICTVHLMEEHDGGTFIALELLEGRTLREELASKIPEMEVALRLGVQLASGLDAAHRKGVVHRDIKPSNLFVTRWGQLKILDFGLAKLSSAEASAAVAEGAPGPTGWESAWTVAGFGTAAYASPEQVAGEPLDARSDLFSAGAVVYELLTGTSPFAAGTREATLDRIRNAPPLPPSRLNPRVPAALDAIVLRALATDRAARYQHASDLAADLERIRRDLAGAWTGTAEPARPSIAVLPFEAPSPDAVLGEGLAEEIIDVLARLEGLKVISRTSAFHVARGGQDPREAGRALGVAHLLTGRLTGGGAAWRVRTELVAVGDGARLQGWKYAGSVGGWRALAGQIASDVALRLGLSPGPGTEEATSTPAREEAYRLVLEGRRALFEITLPGFQRALELAGKALTLERRLASAYALLAEVHHYLNRRHDARTAAMEALALDPSLVEAQTLLGFLRWNSDYDWAGAEVVLRRAIALAPGNAHARFHLATFLSASGRHEEALVQQRAGCEADPLDPFMQANLGFVLAMARRYADAETHLLEVLRTFPGFPLLHSDLAMVRVFQRRFADAREHLEGARPVPMGYGLVWAPIVHRELGDAARSRGALEEVLAVWRSGMGNAFAVAMAHAALGEADAAFEWLERALEDRDYLLPFVRVAPSFDFLRGDPRYAALAQRMRAPGA